MTKQKNTTTTKAGRMMSRREKARIGAGKLFELCAAEGVTPSVDDDRVLSLAWAAAHAVEVLQSTLALPLPTAAQAAKLEREGASVHVLSKGEAMVVLPSGVEVRQYRGKVVPVTDIPDEAYHDIHRLRTTRRITDARKRVLASVGTMVRHAARIAKSQPPIVSTETPADQTVEQPAE